MANYHPQKQQQSDDGCEDGEFRKLMLEWIAEENGWEQNESEIEGKVILAAERQSLEKTTCLFCNQSRSPFVEKD